MFRCRMLNKYTMMAFGVAALGAAMVGYITGFVAATWLAAALAAATIINLTLFAIKHNNLRKHSEESYRTTP